MSDVKLSVIVPVYNVESYIGECLESLVNQTLKELEIVVIDDFSTDSSREVVREYQKKYSNIKLILNEKNLGTGVSRNRGLEAVVGEYVGFVDGDDSVDFDYFERLYNDAKACGADVFVTPNIYSFETKERVCKFGEPLEDFLELDTTRFRAKELFFRTYCWNKIFRRGLITNFSMRFSPNSYAEDVEFLLNGYINASKIVVQKSAKYFYRENRKDSAVNGLKPLKFIAPIVGNIKSAFDIVNNSKCSSKDKKFWRRILCERFAFDLSVAYGRVLRSDIDNFSVIVHRELQNYNIEKFYQDKFHYHILKWLFYSALVCVTFGTVKVLKRKQLKHIQKLLYSKTCYRFMMRCREAFTDCSEEYRISV